MNILPAGRPRTDITIKIKKIIIDEFPKAEIIKVHSFAKATVKDMKESFIQNESAFYLTKKIKVILTIILLFNSKISFSQSKEETAKKSVEIIQWINSFEDNNSPERIMQGTLQDKVHAEYNNGILTVYSMIWQGSKNPPLYIRDIIKINDITRIEAQEKNFENYTIVDIAIFVKEGSISIECKNDNESQFYKWSFEKKWFEGVGFCSKNLRFKFPKESASTEIKRVYNALSDLCILNGGNPKVGSLY